MRAMLYLFLPAVALTAAAQPQVIPGEAPGDLGWVLLGADTLVTVRASEGNAWLQQNLGAGRVAQAVNDSLGYGHLYQWGRWSDGHQLRGSSMALASSLPQNDPSGLGGGSPLFYFGTLPDDWWSGGSAADAWQDGPASATEGIDPCAALGPGWQLPMQNDWVELLTNEGITDATSGFNSPLKLTVGGLRDGQSGLLLNVGSYGIYWSATTSDQFAMALLIGNGVADPTDVAYRSYGMSVRCLHRSLHIGVPEHNQHTDLAIFPNPARDHVALESNEVILTITLRDMSARVVLEVSADRSRAVIALDGLPPGVYHATITTAQGTLNRLIQVER